MELIGSHARVALRGTGSFPDTYTTPRVTMGLRSMWAGELDSARSTLEGVLDHLAERGHYTLATEPHEYLAEIECRAGRYELAARHAATAIEIKLGAGFEELNGLDLYPQAFVDALRGDVSSAREYATQGLAWSERGDRLYANCNRAVLGFLELSLGRFADARTHLDPVVQFLRVMGVREPCVIPVHADAIEARIGMGDLDAAAALLAEFEEQGRDKRTCLGACNRRAMPGAAARRERRCRGGCPHVRARPRRASTRPAAVGARPHAARQGPGRAEGETEVGRAADPSAGARDLR